MNERKIILLAMAFVGLLILLGAVWWMQDRAKEEDRIAACIKMLGDTATERCEQMERTP